MDDFHFVSLVANAKAVEEAKRFDNLFTTSQRLSTSATWTIKQDDVVGQFASTTTGNGMILVIWLHDALLLPDLTALSVNNMHRNIHPT
jgi:hypothetical protein